MRNQTEAVRILKPSIMALKPLIWTVVILLWAAANLFLLRLLALSVQARNAEYKNVVENSFSHTIDLFDEDFQEISRREGIVDVLSEINRRFHTAQSFDFIEANYQSFYFNKEGYRGNPELLLPEKPHGNPEVVRLHGLFAGPNVPQYFDISVDEGEYFQKADYVAPAPGGGISVVLGSAYRNSYQIGDAIDLLVDGEKRTGTVIGFLKKGASILLFNERVTLDEFVLYPREEYTGPPHNEDEYRSRFRALLARNNGIVFPRQGWEEVRAEIDSICAQADLPAYALSMTYEECLRTADETLVICAALFAGFNLLAAGAFIYLRRRKKKL